jgi:DNA mismatch repair ATPase MutL
MPLQGPGEHAKPLSVLGGEFLLAENTAGLWIADLKAIRCQSMLKTLQEAYDNRTCAKRPLLIPKTVLVGERIAQYELNLCDWPRLGFDVDQIGPQQLLVRSVPALLGSEIKNLEPLIIALLDAAEVDDLLHSIVHYSVMEVAFSTEDALQMIKNAPWEQYGKLYRQISMETLREILYRDRELHE